MKRSMFLIGAVALVTGCNQEAATKTADLPVRGLKTFLIEEAEDTTVRRYPSVLQPGSVSTLSFEISGRLMAVNLGVGQKVSTGQVLAEIDPTSLDLQMQSAEAALDQARSNARNAAEAADRQQQLLDKGVTTKANYDQAKTAAETTKAQLVQAERSLDGARENLTKARLSAPYDGILNSVEVQSFANVTAGSAVVTLYAADWFETSFSVSYDVASRLTVGKPAKIRLADNPKIILSGHVSELGARADTVSSFPVVVALDQIDPTIKAGMAVEISLEFAVSNGRGYGLPLSVLPLEGILKPGSSPEDPGSTTVYIYNPATETVHEREIIVAGVRENSLIVIEGVSPGDRVASAGVSFLRDGQKVKLLPDQRGQE